MHRTTTRLSIDGTEMAPIHPADAVAQHATTGLESTEGAEGTYNGHQVVAVTIGEAGSAPGGTLVDRAGLRHELEQLQVLIVERRAILANRVLPPIDFILGGRCSDHVRFDFPGRSYQRNIIDMDPDLMVETTGGPKRFHDLLSKTHHYYGANCGEMCWDTPVTDPVTEQFLRKFLAEKLPKSEAYFANLQEKVDVDLKRCDAIRGKLGIELEEIAPC